MRVVECWERRGRELKGEPARVGYLTLILIKRPCFHGWKAPEYLFSGDEDGIKNAHASEYAFRVLSRNERTSKYTRAGTHPEVCVCARQCTRLGVRRLRGNRGARQTIAEFVGLQRQRNNKFREV
ncbi:hypothetical protein NDU88_000912 [Pleurodeles waltl]|uniref:Uncharacterized protein n=1 Tax=Pleurodeles waltl TaxID=8319 RepID=A0AAV7WGU9_PLEWA|nr:hypothetical protein NDU88_000912 [Pleurodeles waltl]